MNRLYMHRIFNGISINAVNGSAMTCAQNGIVKTITDNTISISPDFVWSADQRGLSFTNSQYFPTTPTEAVQRIQGNKISGFGGPAIKANTNIILAYFNNNGAISGPGTIYSTPHVLCNDLKNAHQGFVFEGKNVPMDWRGNSMRDLIIGAASYSAEIGPQGNATNPSDNKWLGAWPPNGSFGLYSINTPSTNAVLSPIYLDPSGTNMVPPNVSGVPPGFSYAASGAILNCSGNYTNYICGQLNLLKQSNTLPPNGSSLSEEEHYIAAAFVYRLLAINDSMRTSDLDLTTFYESLKSKSIGKFKDIEDVIGGVHPESATALLSDLTTSTFNRAEQAYYDFYTLFLKYTIEVSSFSNDDLQSLQSLCNRCPGVDGPAVFQARALMQTITGQVQPFSSNCNSQIGARIMQQEANGNEKNTQLHTTQADLIIYPNPANSQITIEILNDWKFNEVQIFDITQRLCYKFSLGEFVSKQQLNTDLKNGMYFAKIIGVESEKSVKFCVVK